MTLYVISDCDEISNDEKDALEILFSDKDNREDALEELLDRISNDSRIVEFVIERYKKQHFPYSRTSIDWYTNVEKATREIYERAKMMQQQQQNEKQRIQELEQFIIKLGFILTNFIGEESIIDKMIEVKLNINRDELKKKYKEMFFRCITFTIGDN